MVNNYDHKYYKKYIKYKNKYLQYKRILHGGTQLPQPPSPQPSQPSPLSVIVLASHQNAIGEFLSVLVTNFADTRKKIKNCACLEISKVGNVVKTCAGTKTKFVFSFVSMIKLVLIRKSIAPSEITFIPSESSKLKIEE
jgi:hypothetical protein